MKVLRIINFFVLTLVVMLSCGSDNVDGNSDPVVPPDMSKPGDNVSNTVFVLFNTHLDVGFTNLPSFVENQSESDIPKGLAIIEKLRNTPNRYIWTIDAWVLSEYIDKATPTQRAAIERAIERGDVSWSAMPYTTETEFLTSELFDGMLSLSKELDKRYGKETLAAQTADVPGHSRGIVSSLRRAGVRMLHVGQNKSSTLIDIPVVEKYPDICRWRHPDGNTIIYLRKRAYGHNIDMPNGNVVSFNVKGENLGPHTEAQIKTIYANLRKAFPNKKIIASDFNEVARELAKVENEFPVMTQEVGDTWIHGMGSAPLRSARFRALTRVYRDWLAQGRIVADDPQIVRFAIRLGLVGEHTWGMDSGKFLKNETTDMYNCATFQPVQAAGSNPDFVFCEKSWKEIDDYVDQAIELLPALIQGEARQAVAEAESIPSYNVVGTTMPSEITPDGALKIDVDGNDLLCGLFTLQTLSFSDFRNWTLSMMAGTGAKGGMEHSEAKSASVNPQVKRVDVEPRADGKRIVCEMEMASPQINPLLCPAKVYAEYNVSSDGRSADVVITLIDKPANRMAEELWVSFVPSNITSVSVEKMGHMVNVNDVVSGGNARLMAMDDYVEITTKQGLFRVTSYDVPLVMVGDRANMSYKIAPDLSKGVHFMLFNNLWGVNYSMWWAGSQSFRFKIEKM